MQMHGSLIGIWQPFMFAVVHRPGAQMEVVDFLSCHGTEESAAGRLGGRVVTVGAW